MTENLIAMTNKELIRYEIVSGLIEKKINGTEAAKQLGLSIRQVKRMKARVSQQGAKGVIHKLRGAPSNRKIDEKLKTNTLKYLQNHYSDFKPTLAREKLSELQGINLGITTVRNIMIQEKLFAPKSRKKNKEYRSWRPRKECFGEMQQFDGCYFPWFENRAPECCLLASIDDATGQPTGLEFRENESVKNVFGFWKGYINEHGKPLSIYLDKYSTYKINHKSALDNSELITQFQRAARDLGIQLITAHSPQAKGRIERLFETLQDRLVKELRLRGVSDVAMANKFLKEFYRNDFGQRFAVVPAKKHNLHKPLTEIDRKNLDKIFSAQSKRKVGNDFTIRFKDNWYQLNEIQPVTVCRKDVVLIEERLDGGLHISLRGRYLNFQKLPERPQKVRMKIPALTTTKSPWKPPLDHPWRKQFSFDVGQKQLIINS
ncbi:ISNCY family transposase [Patescibacteria group bacterium]|nr:ISNCY family transposase [Patescibacteria group bacterium]MBU2264741.1 ISNCY family transposase [Patescibacteria group bacterium]